MGELEAFHVTVTGSPRKNQRIPNETSRQGRPIRVVRQPRGDLPGFPRSGQQIPLDPNVICPGSDRTAHVPKEPQRLRQHGTPTPHPIKPNQPRITFPNSFNKANPDRTAALHSAPRTHPSQPPKALTPNNHTNTHQQQSDPPAPQPAAGPVVL
ncbi:hypothetical protein [Actinomadura yumaensis]|uniref:Uncharacterized protein n=1 Tax=Actinomadura yumaensis TaxID=111807 RepID=A0ABW2CCH5_9ACTN